MRLQDAWYRPDLTLKTALLVPSAQLYGLVQRRLRPPAAKTHDFPSAIIAIGNITVGGTGKTPLTLHLAQALHARGFVVGVVSRGYPVSPKMPLRVQPSMPSSACGDEPLLYARAGVPTVVCAERVLALRHLLEIVPNCDVVLADDALQHTALPRDIDLCVVDGVRGFGNGRLLPAGPLREPLTALARCDAIVVNGLGGVDAGAFPSRVPVFQMQLAVTGVRTLAGAASSWDALIEPVSLVAGLGHPQKFFNLAKEFAPLVRIAGEFPFSDHHAFTAAELNALPGASILMTEKDAMRCAELAPKVQKPIFFTETAITLAPDLVASLISRIEAKCQHGCQTP